MTLSSTYTIRLSPTICGEYASRDVFTGRDGWPEVSWDASGAFTKGVTLALPVETVKAIQDDAEHNSNPRAVSVGPHDMPLHVFNAYRALAKQAKAALAPKE